MLDSQTLLWSNQLKPETLKNEELVTKLLLIEQHLEEALSTAAASC